MSRVAGIVYDLGADEADNPMPGDVLVSSRSAYRIIDAVPVASRVAPNRWRLRVQRLGPMPDPRRPPLPAKGGRHWPLCWNRRG
ncbi:MAG TPA: hypothetical protein VHD87_14930 [Acidimicrobiales bacterium]|nr:hypothetical protein [Acidimicrobiales bacterium]